VSDEYHPTVPFVATLDPGTRTFETRSEGEAPPEVLSFDIGTLEAGTTTDVAEPEVLEVTPPDPKSMDLGEAKKIFGGGAGLGGNEAFDLLLRVSASLGASMGATRVVTDAGHVPHWRQIGTTGVTVDPDVYVAFGVSGAVQHTGGLGDPKHIISVNTDPSCPMMTISDLAIVADAGQVLAALAEKLGIAPTGDLDG
jgi:electron transfer flavoprotein alpha subunit